MTKRFPFDRRVCCWLIATILCNCALAQSQTRPAPPELAEGDPALVRILVWQLDRGDTVEAERLMQANLPQMKPRLEELLREVDQEFDILGRFGAVSIRFGPGYGELEEKNRRYEKLFALYRRLSRDDDLWKRFEARKFRVDGAHFTNQGEIACGDQMDWEAAQRFYRQALERLESAFALAQQVNDLRLMASAKMNIGSTEMRLGRPEDALRTYAQSLRYAEQVPGEFYKGLLRLNLGNAYVWIGDPDKSVSYSQEALAIFRRIGRGTWEANALMNLGNAQLRQGKFASAWETLRLTLEAAQKSGENRVYGRALLNLGMAGVQLQKKEAIPMLEEALEWYRKDKEIYPAIEREVVLQDGLRLLGQLARQTGDTATAEKYEKQYAQSLGRDPNRYRALRSSPCFAIYQSRPATKSPASR